MPDSHCQAVLDIMPASLRKSSWWTQKRDLQTLLVKFGESEATEPRDIIYALLGISSDACNTDLLRADYEKPIQEVIRDTISFLLLFHESGHKVLVKLLLETGKVDADSKSNDYGWTPMLYAIDRGHESVVKLLGMDSKSNCGLTPLSYAIDRGHKAVVRLLRFSKGLYTALLLRLSRVS
jgi:hypothetical protein